MTGDERLFAEDDEPRTDDESIAEKVLRVGPGLARVGFGAWLRTAEWAAETTIRTTEQVLGVSAPEMPRRRAEPEEGEAPAPAPADGDLGELRDRGAELLRRSADVSFDDKTHPAYARILEQLAPDEARILRLLAVEGAQPAVDVRDGVPILRGGSQLVIAGASMIGPGAGTRHLDRVRAYLNNLNRLGLIWFSRDPVKDPRRYQVLEAQPEVTDALAEAGRLGRTVRRSIDLTPFGRDFCELCLPLGEIERDAVGLPEDDNTPAEPVGGAQSEESPDTTA